jgi:hypothetical protein
MKKIQVIKKEVDLNNYIKKVAKKTDCNLFIDEDCVLMLNNKPILAYFSVPTELTKFVRQSCKNVKLNNVERLSKGLITKGKNRVFGFRPKRGMSQYANNCSVTGMAKDYPLEHSALCSFAEVASALYKEKFPKEYLHNELIVDKKILPNWRIKSTVFTSGIINKDSVLQYHYDIGHVSKALSVMLTLKSDVIGGGLSIPEIDTYIELRDNTILIFDGQELLHGVTPIVKRSSNAYRFTVVYYSLIQMWKCLTITEEVAKERKVRYDKEHRRSEGKIGALTSDLTKDGKRFNASTHKKLSKL